MKISTRPPERNKKSDENANDVQPMEMGQVTWASTMDLFIEKAKIQCENQHTVKEGKKKHHASHAYSIFVECLCRCRNTCDKRLFAIAVAAVAAAVGWMWWRSRETGIGWNNLSPLVLLIALAFQRDDSGGHIHLRSRCDNSGHCEKSHRDCGGGL